ncbi:hypothetical protein RZS08_20655, partial [Arthrospira platensis SPKY1]|nr:hypothetical protein [Arthrospira platensis SPKY1]
KNLGDQINTEARENFPMFYNNRLYFASEGLPGLGGYDLWVADMQADGNWGLPSPLPEPINSPFDDFAFFEMPEQKAYFSSNRDAYTGDDIYVVDWKTKIPPCFVELKFKVMDVMTGKIIENNLEWLWKWDANEATQIADAPSITVDCQQTVVLEVS